MGRRFTPVDSGSFRVERFKKRPIRNDDLSGTGGCLDNSCANSCCRQESAFQAGTGGTGYHYFGSTPARKNFVGSKRMGSGRNDSSSGNPTVHPSCDRRPSLRPKRTPSRSRSYSIKRQQLKDVVTSQRPPSRRSSPFFKAGNSKRLFSYLPRPEATTLAKLKRAASFETVQIDWIKPVTNIFTLELRKIGLWHSVSIGILLRSGLVVHGRFLRLIFQRQPADRTLIGCTFL